MLKRLGMQNDCLSTAHKLYQASRIKVHEKEDVLERIHSWTAIYLQQEMSNNTILDENFWKQVIKNTFDEIFDLCDGISDMCLPSYLKPSSWNMT